MTDRQVLLERARAMRAQPSPAEQKLWSSLRAGRFAAARFYRQHPIGPYIVDFVARRARLVVEVDGHTHGDDQVYDARRTARLEAQGYRVIRFTNGQVMRNMQGGLEAIEGALDALPSPQPSPTGGGSSL